MAPKLEVRMNAAVVSNRRVIIDRAIRARLSDSLYVSHIGPLKQHDQHEPHFVSL